MSRFLRACLEFIAVALLLGLIGLVGMAIYTEGNDIYGNLAVADGVFLLIVSGTIGLEW